MTDEVQKIRENVERLKSQLLRGACSSQVAMETRCKEEAYNEVLAILDTMQKEPKFKVGNKIKYKYNNICTKPRIIAKICGLSHYVDTDNYRMDIAYTDANFELVGEPKKCMYSKDDYTDEDRKVLCDDCEEDCKYNKKGTVNDHYRIYQRT